MDVRLASPQLGGRPLEDREGGLPADAVPVFAEAVGYVQHVDMAALQERAQQHGTEIFVAALPGVFADPSQPVALLSSSLPSDVRDSIAKAFTIGKERTFDQDPRFGFCVLAEIASRALSPAVNDPGTAIDVIGRASRLLVQWGRSKGFAKEGETKCPFVWVPAISANDLLDDVFAPIARDGSRLVEVHLRLQNAFAALLATDRLLFREAVELHSAHALKRAEADLATEEERGSVRALAAKVSAAGPGSALMP
jgi:uncharacterized membrane protein